MGRKAAAEAGIPERLQPIAREAYLCSRTHLVLKEYDMGNTAYLIPIVLFVCITFALTFSINAVLEARVRRQMISAGSEELIASFLKSDEQMRRLSSLRWGVILTAIGLGFAVIEFVGWRDVSAGFVAVLAGATGLGNLAFYVLSRKLA
jgi:dolichol kinase